MKKYDRTLIVVIAVMTIYVIFMAVAIYSALSWLFSEESARDLGQWWNILMENSNE